MEKECAELGLTSWAAAAAVAKNRDRWRALVSSPIPHSGKELSNEIFHKLGYHHEEIPKKELVLKNVV